MGPGDPFDTATSAGPRAVPTAAAAHDNSALIIGAALGAGAATVILAFGALPALIVLGSGLAGTIVAGVLTGRFDVRAGLAGFVRRNDLH